MHTTLTLTLLHLSTPHLKHPLQSIYVTSVVGGGAASSALKVGDKLLQVDGVDLRSSDMPTASSILNKTLSTVNLMVSRLQ